MGKVGLVADSTVDLGAEWLEAHDVTMVPLVIRFGDDTFRDWVDMGPDEFYERLAASSALPKTSQPSPADFEAVYERLAEEGCEEIVSVHLTSALSGTFESATLASANAPIPVRVVDTRLVSHATGLAVKAAAAARDDGGTAADVEEAAIRTAGETRLFFVLDTLEYLVKGGRAGRAQGLAASVLNIKPILHFADGVVEPFKRIRGRKQAVAELAAHLAEESADTPMKAAILHASAPDLAEELRVALDDAGARYDLDMIGQIGPVIGTYAGPRAVGVAYCPER